MSTRELLLENIESVKQLIAKHESANPSPSLAASLNSLSKRVAYLEEMEKKHWCKCPRCGHDASPRAPKPYLNECHQCQYRFSDEEESQHTAGLTVNS